MTAARIFIVDDHPLLCEGLRRTIVALTPFTVSGECGDGGEALERIIADPPDIAIVDLTLRGLGGRSVIAGLLARVPMVRILVYTADADPAVASSLLRQGVRGYVLKEESGRQVVCALERVLAGEVYVTERLRESLINALVDDTARSDTPETLLSRRELEVLRLLGQGLGGSEIAEHLTLSTNTIASYRERIKQKLGLGNARELLRYATRWVGD